MADKELELLGRVLTQSSEERQAQTRAFTDAINSQTRQIWIIAMILIVLIAGALGVQLSVSLPGGGSISSIPDQVPATETAH